jgi:hypothetical protein
MGIKYKGEDNPNSSHYRILRLRIGLQREVRRLCGVDFQGETTTVIDFGVGRHTLVSREDHPDSPSFFRIATDTTLDPFKGIHIN